MTAADYSPYCVTAPIDPRLPGGGGNQLCGLFDVNPTKFGQTLNVIQDVEPLRHAGRRLRRRRFQRERAAGKSIYVSGGVSIGRERLNNCYAQIDLSLMSAFADAGLPSRCDVRPPFQPNVKFLGRLPVAVVRAFRRAPRSRAFPGPQITASYTATNALIAPSLGRNLSAGANGTGRSI